MNHKQCHSYDSYGNQIYYKDKKRHRIDGPAFICVDGSQSYWINNKLHRVGGAALIWAYHRPPEYWIDGKQVTELEHDLLYGIMKLKGLI
jgi:hypothetical protein